MKEAGVRLRVVYTDEDLLEIQVDASNGIFAGRATVWEDSRSLDALAILLNGFPTNKTDVREYELGTFRSDGAGGGVALRFSCTDYRGHSTVEVRLQTDSTGQADCARIHIPVAAADVDTFIKQLVELPGDVGAEAWLQSVR